MEEHKWLIIKVLGISFALICVFALMVDGCSRKKQELKEVDRIVYVSLERQNALIERQNKLLGDMYKLMNKIQECECK